MKYNSIENDLQMLVDMYWDDEWKHWEEDGNPQTHIFHAINNVKNFLIGRKNGQNN